MLRRNLAALALLACMPAFAAQTEKLNVRSGDVDVPVEVTRPDGRGPFPAVLYIHAKRGFDDVDRAHMEALAAQGFLVLAPDYLSGRFIERWPDRHYPETEADVEAALDALLKRADVCRGPVAVLGKSRGGYYAVRLAAKRGRDLGAIATYYGHFQDPNAPEPQQLFRYAPEVNQLATPLLMLIGDADFELRRMNNGRTFYALIERGAPVELQMYPMARRAFDFRNDQSPEEKIAARHAAARVKDWFHRHLRLSADGRCPG